MFASIWGWLHHGKCLQEAHDLSQFHPGVKAKTKQRWQKNPLFRSYVLDNFAPGYIRFEELVNLGLKKDRSECLVILSSTQGTQKRWVGLFLYLSKTSDYRLPWTRIWGLNLKF